MTELTAFQRDLIRIMVRSGPMTGQEVRQEWWETVGKDVNNGRLYPNLDTLTEKGIVEKSQKNQRANLYNVTDFGRELLSKQVSFDKGVLS